MEEKKTNISTILLILAIIIIVVMGVIIFKLNNEKLAETQKASDYETQIASLNEEISALEDKLGKINNTINGDSSTSTDEDTDSEISSFTNGVYTTDTSSNTDVNFLKDSEFNIGLDDDTIVFGEYKISDKTIKCTMTYHTFKEPNGAKKVEFPEDETWNLSFDIVDDKTIKVKRLDIPMHESEIAIGLSNVFTEGTEFTVN